MIGCYDFCGHYEWTFGWLEREGGHALVRDYWNEAINHDSQRHARELIELVRDVPCKLNLIPFNPFPGSGFETSPRERIRSFAKRLQDAGIVATIRKTRGDDIAAACGQLAGQVQDRTKRRLATRIPLSVAR